MDSRVQVYGPAVEAFYNFLNILSDAENDWVDAAVASRQREGQRFGQAVFNVVCSQYPSVNIHTRGTLVDPFHDDTKVPEFLDQVLEVLTRPGL